MGRGASPNAHAHVGARVLLHAAASPGSRTDGSWVSPLDLEICLWERRRSDMAEMMTQRCCLVQVSGGARGRV